MKTNPTSRNRKIIGSYMGKNLKRKHSPCGRSMSKSYKGISLFSNSHAVRKVDSFDSTHCGIGEDGHYYECMICENGGDLLCCDTCPRTYHLQCLSPYLESVPSGNWQCQNCCEAADLMTPLKYFRSSKGNASSNKNAANHAGEEQKTEVSTAVNEIKVYRRRVKKKGVEQEENDPRKLTRDDVSSETANGDQKDVPNTDASGLFNPSRIQPGSVEQADKVLENDNLSASKPHRPKDSDQNPVEEQGGEMGHHAMNISVCTQSLNTNQGDKLWILRDVMQESMKGLCFKQNNVGTGRNSQQALHPYFTESGKSKKEKFARLRARQKQRIALRYRGRGLIPSSGIVRWVPSVWLHAEEVSETVKEKMTLMDKLQNNLGQIHGHLNCFQSLPGIADPIKLQHRQIKFGGKLLGCSSHQASDGGSSARISLSHREFINQLIPSTVSGGGHSRPLVILNPNLSSASQLSNNNMMMMSNNLRKDEGSIDVWLEEELDSLWIGVRRHGQRNWEHMLRDPSLSFSKHKTVADLLERWSKEKLKILNPGILPSFKDQLPSNGGNRVQQNLLLGGLINIPKVEELSKHQSQILRNEAKELSSEGTVSE